MNHFSGRLTLAALQKKAENYKHIMDDRLLSLTGFKLALLVTGDGFQVAHTGGGEGYSLDKIGAITSSIFSLMGALTKELKLTNSRQLILETDIGKLLVAACDGEIPMILLVLMNEEATLAQFRFAAGKAVSLLEQV